MPLINNDLLDEPLGGKKGNLTRIIIIILNPHSNLNTGITVWSMQASKKNSQNNIQILRLVHTYRKQKRNGSNPGKMSMVHIFTKDFRFRIR